jgi:hypothetical protein
MNINWIRSEHAGGLNLVYILLAGFCEHRDEFSGALKELRHEATNFLRNAGHHIDLLNPPFL